jgi:hypothetical protein
MPLPKGTRYRFKTTPSGKKIRLAFSAGSNKVIEAKRFVKQGGKLVKREDLKEKFKERRKNKQ